MTEKLSKWFCWTAVTCMHRITVNLSISVSDRSCFTFFNSKNLDFICKVADALPCVKISKTKTQLHNRNGKGETLLHKACMRDDLAQVKALIRAGICINMPDHAGLSELRHCFFSLDLFHILPYFTLCIKQLFTVKHKTNFDQ